MHIGVPPFYFPFELVNLVHPAHLVAILDQIDPIGKRFLFLTEMMPLISDSI